MNSARLRLLGVLTLPLLLLGVSSCALESSPSPEGTSSSAEAPATDDKNSGAAALDADGILIPGQVVNLSLGESVTYYSMPNLTKDDVQKVTIHSFEYMEKDALPANAPLDKLKTGVLVVSLSWEGIKGSVQSNQGYLIATLNSGEEGIPWAFLDGRLRNGGVELGETKTGTFTIEIDRGPTTLTLVDYTDVPVARLLIDSSK